LRLVFFCADGAAKVGRVDWRRNFRIAEDSVLNLPSDAKVADESMLRASQPQILSQQYLVSIRPEAIRLVLLRSVATRGRYDENPHPSIR
jgi:hypothetical protein